MFTTPPTKTEFNRETLAALQAKHLPTLKGSDFLEIKEDGPEARKAMAEADEYLKAFVKADPTELCVLCGSRLGAKDAVDAFLFGSTFEWGLAWGEGFCRACGYPGRAHHDAPGFKVFNLILQYHPDGLSFEKR